MEQPHEFGVVGLGQMGSGLALQAAEKGIRVVAADKARMGEEFARAGIIEGESLGAFRDELARPRVVFIYVPAGPLVDTVLDELSGTLERGDVVLDGGNSYWGDSIRRHERMQEAGIHLLDLGTSGGVDGARHGACFMVGGASETVGHVEPILKTLAVEGGYGHAGPPGAGHFTKLVHNGIEFGMLQAIAEGVDLLEHYHEQLPVADVLGCWRHGSVIRPWLVDLMEAEYRQEGGLANTPPFIEDTGEVNWLIADALEMERPVPAITQTVTQLLASRDSSKQWAKAVAMMRHRFGGHPYGEDANIRRERRRARVGDVWRRK